MRGNTALALDLVHMTAARGLLVSVVLLMSTGLYATLLHVNTFSLLVGSSYGRVLLLKLIVLTIILLLAALNRWYVLPRLLEREANFRRILFVEASLLVIVLLVTGLLTTTAPPNM